MNKIDREDKVSHGSASEETDKNDDEENPFPLPDKVGYEEELKPKEGVKKKILEVGEGRDKPESLALVTATYKAYFTKSEKIFDSGENVEISLNDPSLLEGFKVALESMRKNEKSIFTIKSKYAFKNPNPSTKLPKEYTAEELKKKGVTYEIKLLDFKKRNNISNEENLMKTEIVAGKGYRMPSNFDCVKLSYEISQPSSLFIKKEKINIIVDETKIGETLSAFIKDMTVGEVSICDVKKEYFTKKDSILANKPGINPNEDIKIKAELHDFIRGEDYYNDKSTLKVVLKTGKVGTAPGIDCTVKFRTKIIVNDEVRFSNVKLKGILSDKKWEFADLSESDDTKITTEEPLIYRLDEYRLPPIFTKNLKEMCEKEVVRLNTCKFEKLKAYIPDSVFSQDLFKDASKVTIFIYLVSAENLTLVSNMKLPEKKQRLLNIKENAIRLFKAGCIKKACKLFQKINSYFSLGDINNLVEGESKDTEEYKKVMEELNTIKKQCYVNATMCKFKLKDYKKTIEIADQILILDPQSVKAFYWKAKALRVQQEFTLAIDSIKKAIAIEPNNQDIINEYKEILDAKKKLEAIEKKKYCKLFNN